MNEVNDLGCFRRLAAERGGHICAKHIFRMCPTIYHRAKAMWCYPNVRGRYILYEEAVACIRYQMHI